MPELTLIPLRSARIFYEGAEVCAEYLNTRELTFGTSSLQAGETGAIDPGHPISRELFYVSRGSVRISNPETKASVELSEGDAVIVQENVPHQLTNIGTAPALLTWSAVPGLAE